MNWSRRQLLAALASTPALGCSLRQANRPPAIPSHSEVRVPHITRAEANGGPRLYASSDHRVPLVSLAIGVRAGYRQEPHGLEGRASIAGALLSHGMLGGDRIDLLSRYGELGTRPSIRVDDNRTFIYCTVQKERAPLALRLLAENLQSATFAEDALTDVRREAKGWFAMVRGEPSMVAGLGTLAAGQGFAPATAGLRQGTPSSVDAIDRQAVIANFAGHLDPSALDLVVAGDVTEEQAQAWSAHTFGQWSSPTTPASSAPTRSTTRPADATLVPSPSSAQAFLALGCAATGSAVPPPPAEKLAVDVVASLMQYELRAKQRTTYAVQKIAWESRAQPYYTLWTAIDPLAIKPAIEAVRELVDALLTRSQLNEATIAQARRSMQMSMMNSFHGCESTLGRLMTMANNDAAPRHINEQLDAMDGLSAASVSEAIEQLFSPQRLSYCVVAAPPTLAVAEESLSDLSVQSRTAQQLLGMPLS